MMRKAAELRARLLAVPGFSLKPKCPMCRMEKEPKQFCDRLCWTCRGKTKWDGVDRRAVDRG